MILQEGNESCHRNVLCLQQALFRCSTMAYHPLICLSLAEDGPQPTCHRPVPTYHPPCSCQSISLLPSMKLSVKRRELPPGEIVELVQFPQQERENGQAGSFPAKDNILGMSPPVYFTARLHCSVPPGKQR